jgi:sialidase-1
VSPTLQLTDVFVAGEGNYHTYRIPSVIITPKGNGPRLRGRTTRRRRDAGDIDLVLRRSHDTGTSWSPLQVIGDNGANTFGNPCAVIDARTNTVWLLITQIAAPIASATSLPGPAKAHGRCGPCVHRTTAQRGRHPSTSPQASKRPTGPGMRPDQVLAFKCAPGAS